MNTWGVTAGITDDLAEAGGSIRGEVHRDPIPGERDPLRGVIVSLHVRASGAGDPDIAEVSAVEIKADAGRITSRFELPVPADGPISYAGRLMTVEWWIEVRIDVARRRDTLFEYPVLVVPRGGLETYTGPHPLF